MGMKKKKPFKMTVTSNSSRMTKKEFKTKTNIGDLIASSPYISEKKKKKMIGGMFK